MNRPPRLTQGFVDGVRKPGRYGDGRGGHGLSLLVKPTAAGTWPNLSKTYSQRVTLHGKQITIGLGPTWAVKLAEVRDVAVDNHRMARRGIDPRGERETSKAPTFAQASEAALKINAPNWRGPRAVYEWNQTMETYVHPRIGHMPVDTITGRDILGVLTYRNLWTEKRSVAKRALGRMRTVFGWAIAEGHRTDDPTIQAAAGLPKHGAKGGKHKALPHAGVSTAIRTLRERDGWPLAKLALEFTILTAARSGEVRGATWDEIDLATRTWTIPAARMKAGVEHRVPLSDHAAGLLNIAAAKGRGIDSEFVFPAPTGKMLVPDALSRQLKRADINAVPHGFRASFRSWAADTGAPRELAEAAIAHAVPGVEGAYQRSDLFDRRRDLMAAWADYLGA